MKKNYIEKKFTVLVIDDDEVVRMLIRAMLESVFYILTAASSKKGLELIRDNEVNVTILDLNLSDAYGLDTLREIKTNYSNIEVIMITSLKEKSTASLAMEMGAFEFMLKDLRPDDLKERVWRAISSFENNKGVLNNNLIIHEAHQ